MKRTYDFDKPDPFTSAHAFLEIRAYVYIFEWSCPDQRLCKMGVDDNVGIGNVLGNKGAVAAALTIRSTRLLFICAHFAAHEKQIQQRNAEAARIRAGLFLRSPIAGGACLCNLSCGR